MELREALMTELAVQEPVSDATDAGNALLAETPASWTLSLAETPGGQRAVVTFRTPSTTLTLLMTRQDALKLGSDVTATAQKLSASGLIVAGGGL